MHTDEFCDLSLKTFNGYLQRLSRLQNEGRIRLWPPGGVLLYPQILLCVETPEWHIAELVGHSREYRPLILKRHKARTINTYLGQFEVPISSGSMLRMKDSNNTLAAVCLMQDGAKDELERRFPWVSTLAEGVATIVGVGDAARGNMIHIEPSANYIRLQHCLLANKHLAAIRLHHISLSIIIKRSETPEKYADYLAKFFQGDQAQCVTTVDRGAREHLMTATSFARLYLLDKLHEVTIGEFLNQNQDILRTAFNATKLVYEPYLKWIVGNDDSDEAINPDLMIQRADGSWLVCDLKLPLLNRASITKAERKRRRFIDPVNEGAAQLAEYAQYFEYEQNREYARKRLGAEVMSPGKVLIIGNYENTNTKAVEEASRMLSPLELIDYDSLVQLYLLGKGLDLVQAHRERRAIL